MKKLLILINLLCFGLMGIYAQEYPEIIKIKGGSFTMGDENGDGREDEKPAHKVSVNTFYMSKTEITVAQYRTYCKATGVKMPRLPYGTKDDFAMTDINWRDAVAYTKWLAKTKNYKEARLPTEAEWEYAAKGGKKGKSYKYSGSNTVEEVGYVNTFYEQFPVAKKKPNALGLYDMSGGVWEFCMDYYSKDYYAESPEKNPRGPKGDLVKRITTKVIRGGSYNSSETQARVTARRSFLPTIKTIDVGFRVVVVL